jgi:hypothetical protein
MEFSKEEVQMGNKYMHKCSTSLATEEMQTKITLRFHLIPVRMAIFKGNDSNKCKFVQLWKAVWRFLKKLKIELLYDPVILLLGIYPKERKSG